MSVNKYAPHIFILPEDDANRQIVNGFLLDEAIASRQIFVLEEAGGWNEVLLRFESIYAAEMEHWQLRCMLLLIDFDQKPGRLNSISTRIQTKWPHLIDRVFVVGAWSEPESLKQALGMSYESIGRTIAQDCREGTNSIWGHRLLQNNAAEVGRLRKRVQPILFPSN